MTTMAAEIETKLNELIETGAAKGVPAAVVRGAYAIARAGALLEEAAKAVLKGKIVLREAVPGGDVEALDTYEMRVGDGQWYSPVFLVDPTVLPNAAVD